MEIKEVRSLIDGIEIETRADGAESRTISGYGIVFDKWSSDLGWFKEIVRAESVNGEALKGDIIATFNHNFDQVMARTAAKSLTLKTDKRGVKYSFEAPNTTAGNDLLENIRIGNIRGSSFTFTVKKDRWTFSQKEGEPDEREILELGKVFELGPVVMPAYPDTTAAKRSRETVIEAEKKSDPTPSKNAIRARVQGQKFKLIRKKG